MNPVSSRLLGFDIRRRPEDYVDSDWTRDRRELYLLRPEVRWPLSVDTAVWPTVFEYRFSATTGARPYPRGTTPVDPGYSFSGLWRDLAHMRAIHKQHQIDQIVGIEIGVCLFVDPRTRTDSSSFLLLDDRIVPPVVPPELPTNSSLLGYDVADGSLVSGLCNCASDTTTMRELQTSWSSSVNEYGLIETLDNAIRFRSIADARVPEHSPFWIFGIYRLP